MTYKLWIILIQYDVCLWRELGHNNCCFKILSVVSPQLWRFLFCFCISSIKFNSLETQTCFSSSNFDPFQRLNEIHTFNIKIAQWLASNDLQIFGSSWIAIEVENFFIIILWKYLSNNTFATTCLKQNMNFFFLNRVALNWITKFSFAKQNQK